MAKFSRFLALGFAACFSLWAIHGYAAGNGDRLKRLQAQEEILTELESAHGSLNPSLVRPLRNIIELLREQSEFERAAEFQLRLLAVMEANPSRQSPDWIPMLKEMVVEQVNSGETAGVGDLLLQLRTLSAARNDPVALVQMVELQAHWLLTGGAGPTHEDRIDAFLAARDLITNDYVYLVRELFEDNDPKIIPWMYRVALNHHQTVELLTSGSGIGARAKHNLDTHTGAGVPIRGFMQHSLNWMQDIGEILEANGDNEGHAMAKLYEADFEFRVSLSNPYRPRVYRKYEEARELLREAGVEEDRISLFFGRPRLAPFNRFYHTLEEAITDQESGLAAWRPEQEVAAHVAIFHAWNNTVPGLMKPVSDHVFWNFPSSSHQVDLQFNINSQGVVSSLKVLYVEPADSSIRKRVRRAVESMRFVPMMENNRRLGLRDVHMRVMVPY